MPVSICARIYLVGTSERAVSETGTTALGAATLRYADLPMKKGITPLLLSVPRTEALAAEDWEVDDSRDTFLCVR